MDNLFNFFIRWVQSDLPKSLYPEYIMKFEHFDFFLQHIDISFSLIDLSKVFIKNFDKTKRNFIDVNFSWVAQDIRKQEFFLIFSEDMLFITH